LRDARSGEKIATMLVSCFNARATDDSSNGSSVIWSNPFLVYFNGKLYGRSDLLAAAQRTALAAHVRAWLEAGAGEQPTDLVRELQDAAAEVEEMRWRNTQFA
jgi:hypothetical protein